MRVLVACEYSGVVRDAFRRRGHDALSCDLLPTEAPGPHHEGPVEDLLDEEWDLVVAHPPCTYLSNSGVRWLYTGPLRWQKLLEGAAFFSFDVSVPYFEVVCGESGAVEVGDDGARPGGGVADGAAVDVWAPGVEGH